MLEVGLRIPGSIEERFAGRSEVLALAELIPALIAVADSEGEVEYINRTGAEWLGWDKDRAGNLIEAIHPEDRPAFIDGASSSPDADETLKSVVRVRLASGHYRWISTRMAPLLDGLGQTSSWVIVAVDVHETHLRQEGMEFALQSAKALTLSLDFDETVQVVWEYAPSMGDWTAMYLFEPDGELRRCCYDLQTNELGSWTVIDSAEPHKAPTAIHLQEGESMSFPGGETNVAWDPCARIDADLKRLLKGVHFRTLYNVPLISHEERFGSLVVIRKTPLHADDETGRRIRLFGMRLATALGNARLYSEAKARSDAWERVSEAKSEFLGLVSHELRNPLTVIYGGLESLVSHKDAPEEERQEVLLATQKETRRLRYMVEDLLAMSRIESKGRSQLEPVLLQRQVRLILSEFSDRWRDNVFFFVDEGLPPVWGEPTFVGQVLRNLVDNADKYSPRHLPIEVTIGRQDDRTVVSVADHGPGVHDDELQQIFERFYQAAELRGQSGLGLGLTVCRRLVEAQGGRIWAESRQEGGLVVSFTLDDVDLS